GLTSHQLYRTAGLYAAARAAFIGWTMGVNHSSKGTETVNAINNLALITGNIGRAGAAPFSITGQCNAMGTRESGFASSLPGYRKFENADDRARPGVSRHHRGGARPTHTGVVDHRHQPSCLVSQLRLAPPGARVARFP